MDATTTKENLLPEFKLSSIAIPIGVILLFLSIILFMLLFNQGFSFSKPETKTSVAIIIIKVEVANSPRLLFIVILVSLKYLNLFRFCFIQSIQSDSFFFKNLS